MSGLDFVDVWARFLRWVTRNQELKNLMWNEGSEQCELCAELLLP